LFGDKDVDPDIENSQRFWKRRDISNIDQSEWQFEIFKASINTRIKASGIIMLIFIIISCILYEVLIFELSTLTSAADQMINLKKNMVY
jgi:hypothetical protein